jgi:hypothetical protein
VPTSCRKWRQLTVLYGYCLAISDKEEARNKCLLGYLTALFQLQVLSNVELDGYNGERPVWTGAEKRRSHSLSMLNTYNRL